ncbi:hypothetical protein CHRY9390_02924 [Chryseobacterium aquaeductus]|uniref:HTH araC/xylS-type domain-containing protein n=1 Tax=Chryseobacterium aquaeductus TaxID=2675056 RepID=A0A9N8QVU9_9FLAO|nr:helix-turn-helix domain-containing protein [Chryseobacterium aquaeductus]CAA7332203.1 hypothetical protein CHRY9390_02924 [Chryseobacterium potabilaquae]CAD7815149.1 hypothetical protein CHRY9390_02924 [Chryseobacterium aquaeductus]
MYYFLFKSLIVLFLIIPSYFSAQYKKEHPQYSHIIENIEAIHNYKKKEDATTPIDTLKKSGNICLYTRALSFEAKEYYLIKNHLNKALETTLQCLQITEKNKNKMHQYCYKIVIKECARRLFYVYRKKGEPDKALKIISKYKSFYDDAEFLRFRYISYLDLHNYEKGIETARLFLKTTEKTQLEPIANTHNIVGYAFTQRYEIEKKTIWLDSAKSHYKKAFEYGNSFNHNLAFNSILYHARLARIETQKGNYQNAIKYYQKHYKSVEITKNISEYQSYCYGLAENYWKSANEKEAFKYLSKLDSLSKKTSIEQQYYAASLNLYREIYQKKGNLDKALHYANLYLVTIQKLESHKDKTQELITLIDADEAHEKIEQISIVKRKFIYFWGVLFIIVVSIVVLISIIYQKRLWKKHKPDQSLIFSPNKKDIEVENTNNIVSEEFPPAEKTEFFTDIEELERINTGMLKLEEKEEFVNPDFKLSFVAKKLKTNTSYLSAYFNHYLGKNFNEYVQEKRITYLIQLLDEDPKFHRYTIQAIAEHIGYKSASAFTKIFKKHMGKNFSDYKQKFKHKQL